MYTNEDFYDEKDEYTTSKRPNHGPKQVRSIEELVVGQTYILVTLLKRKKGKLTKIDLEARRCTFVTEYGEETGFFTDLGMIPYEGGCWNTSNCVLRE